MMNISEPGVVLDVNVVISASHTWVGDLIFTLNHDGKSVTLSSTGLAGLACLPLPYGCRDSAISLPLPWTMTLISPVEDECSDSPPAIAGRFQPDESLSAFNDR